MNFVIIIFLVVFIVINILVWLFFGNGLDMLKNPNEWRSKGSSGERILWLTLVKKYGVPENQIFRNVYIPTKTGTTEIDLIIVSKKGLLVFECKNYSGNIYGDGTKNRWVQYVGNKKSFFLNPLIQNRNHVKWLKDFFKDIPGLPIIPFFVTTSKGKWKLKNINPDDHVLYWNNIHFDDVYDKIPDSKIIAKHYDEIIEKLHILERPSEEIRQKHVDSLKK